MPSFQSSSWLQVEHELLMAEWMGRATRGKRKSSIFISRRPIRHCIARRIGKTKQVLRQPNTESADDTGRRRLFKNPSTKAAKESQHTKRSPSRTEELWPCSHSKPTRPSKSEGLPRLGNEGGYQGIPAVETQGRREKRSGNSDGHYKFTPV